MKETRRDRMRLSKKKIRRPSCVSSGKLKSLATWSTRARGTSPLLWRKCCLNTSRKKEIRACSRQFQSLFRKELTEEQRKDARQEKLTKFKHILIGPAQGGGRELHQVTKATLWRGETKNPGHGGSRRDV